MQSTKVQNLTWTIQHRRRNTKAPFQSWTGPACGNFWLPTPQCSRRRSTPEAVSVRERHQMEGNLWKMTARTQRGRGTASALWGSKWFGNLRLLWLMLDREGALDSSSATSLNKVCLIPKMRHYTPCDLLTLFIMLERQLLAKIRWLSSLWYAHYLVVSDVLKFLTMTLSLLAIIHKLCSFQWLQCATEFT